MAVLMAGLPDTSAWHRFLRHRENQLDTEPVTDPDEATQMLAQHYPGLGG